MSIKQKGASLLLGVKPPRKRSLYLSQLGYNIYLKCRQICWKNESFAQIVHSNFAPPLKLELFPLCPWLGNPETVLL